MRKKRMVCKGRFNRSVDVRAKYISTLTDQVLSKMNFGGSRRKRRKHQRSSSSSSSSSSCSCGDNKKRLRTNSDGDNTSGRNAVNIQSNIDIATSPVDIDIEGELSDSENKQGLWAQCLPVEILSLIFSHLANTCGGAIPVLTRVSRVCRTWRHVAARGELWTRVDLSKVDIKQRTTRRLSWLISSGRIDYVQNLNIDGWGKVLNDANLPQLAAKCSRLVTLNISGCQQLSAQQLHQLIPACPQLQQLYADRLTPRVSKNQLISAVISAGEQLSARLTHLSLAGNTIGPLRQLISTLSQCCSGLQLLDLSNVQVRCGSAVCVDMWRFQQGCPQLRVLRWTNTAITVKSSAPLHPLGFAELRELSVAQGASTCSIVDGGYLWHVLHGSHQLQLLDIRGCRLLSAVHLQRLPAGLCCQLFLSGCDKLLRDPLWPQLVTSWAAGLTHLDLAGCIQCPQLLAEAVTALCAPHARQLHWIDLSASCITAPLVLQLIESCDLLEVIDLTSCRLMPRGVKRRHENIALLRSRLYALQNLD